MSNAEEKSSKAGTVLSERPSLHMKRKTLSSVID